MPSCQYVGILVCSYKLRYMSRDALSNREKEVVFDVKDHSRKLVRE